MRDETDVEARITSHETCASQQEEKSLLLTVPTQSRPPHFTGISYRQHAFGMLRTFVLGVLACLLAQAIIFRSDYFNFKIDAPQNSKARQDAISVLAPGSTTVHNFPPPHATNVFPTLFPTDVGHAGITATGGEPGVIATAPYPMQTCQCSHESLAPKLLKGETKERLNLTSESVGIKKKPKLDLSRSWGNLSPSSSVERGRFGLDSSPLAPETCRVTGLHVLHRHGARYPTSHSGSATFATKLHGSVPNWHAKGELDFLNDWTYKLGEEILTPVGRQQLYNLGIVTRMNYGFLLENFTENNAIPIFRTESQDRMLYSALNFALGFFGYPLKGKYQQSITIEGVGFNNTLCPYLTCPNFFNGTKGDRGKWYTDRWTPIYLRDARNRLQKQFVGFDLSFEDVSAMQELCAFETVALGYSKFCGLFTEEESEGFDYGFDLRFWYGWGFGSPMARALGLGYVQELVARLTHTPIQTHNSSTNATLTDSSITFPLDQSIYVDATHDITILTVLTALNLTTFAKTGPLPYDHIPPDRTFRSTDLVPFAANVQFQLLECTSVPGPQIRVIVNDGVVPLTGVGDCPEQADGMCPLDTFVAAQKETIRNTDWQYVCYGDWEVPPGPEWETVTGDPPKPN